MQQNGFNEKIKELGAVPESISPENIEKKLDEQKRRNSISMRKRIISIAAAFAIVMGGAGTYLYRSGYFDKDGGSSKKSAIQKDDNSSKGSSSSKGDSSSNSGLVLVDDGKDTEYELTGFKTLSYDELNEYFKKAYEGDESKSVRSYEMNDEETVAESDTISAKNGTGTASADNSSKSSDTNTDYSETYLQEAGIDEADIIKTDGKNIFCLCGSSLFTIECDNGNMTEHYIDFSEMFGEEYNNCGAREMYLNGGELVVVLDSYNYYGYHILREDAEDREYTEIERQQPTVSVISLDVTDAANVKATGRFTMEGRYSNSRMVDGQLYLVTSSGVNFYNTYEEAKQPEFVPMYTINGEKHFVSSGDILIPDDEDNYWNYTNVSLIDTKKNCDPVAVKTMLGYTGQVYQTSDRLFVFGGKNGYNSETDEYINYSIIVGFDTEGGRLAPMASGKIDGIIKDRYSLSYRGGILTAVTTETNYDREEYEYTYKNCLFCLNDKMEVVGKCEGFGEDEVVKSVTFKDNYAYVVTFMQTDPLFAIDLSDPTNPTIVSELKMPGFSSHMRAFTNGRIVGFGKTADEDTGRTTGLKLSVYDNSDPDNVKELSTVEMKEVYEETGEKEYAESIWSAAEYDEKALLIDADKNIIAFPYQIYKDWYYYNEDDENKMFKNEREAGYRFYSFSDKDGLTLVGEYKTTVTDDEEGYYEMPNFERAIYIGSTYYLLSSYGVVSVDMNTFREIQSVDLHKYINNSSRGLIYDDGYAIEE